MKARSLCVSALALSAVAGAHAQTSSVTVYGFLDVAGAVQSRTDLVNEKKYFLNTDTGSSGRLGFRGREDLGGGLAAIFNLEAAVAADTGAPITSAASGTVFGAAATQNAFFRRNSWVGLEGGFGQVTLGRNYTAGILDQAATMTALTTGINTGFATAVASQGIGNDFWNSNQIRYQSPRMAGFQFTGALSAGEQINGANKAGSTAAADLSYINGPIQLAATYQKNYASLAAEQGKSLQWYAISGAYKFGDFRVTAGYDRVDNGDNIAQGPAYAGWVDSKLMTVGLAYSITPLLVVSGQYYEVKDMRPSALRGASTKEKSKQALLEAQYYLSKRSSLYAIFNHVDAGSIATSPIWGNLNPVANNSVNGLAIGMQHSF